ncbi:MAG: hypothetical protein JNJ53_08435 [Rhizobiales bacterium]|nr:hypothetical protein [Hyphomicrobiales bacterium]
MRQADKKSNLIIITRRETQDWRDFASIAQEVVKIAPDIAVHLVSPNDTAAVIDDQKWQRPGITVCVGNPGGFVPRRGPLFHNWPVKKLDQYSRLKNAGIPTPYTERFEFGRDYSEADFGEFVILKPLPLQLTSRGSSATLYRTRRLRELKLSDFPETHFLHDAPGLVQAFVDTGPYVSKWRVLTMFGDALYSSTSVSPLPRAALDASDAEIEASVVEPRTAGNIAADPEGLRDRLAKDDEILAFARRMHSVFPTLPALGCDILRRASDGQLFALEINGGGNCWHFSSYAAKHRERLGGREGMVAQFGAWTVAANSLIRMVRQYAA